jgi:hypothetical protein
MGPPPLSVVENPQSESVVPRKECAKKVAFHNETDRAYYSTVPRPCPRGVLRLSDLPGAAVCHLSPRIRVSVACPGQGQVKRAVGRGKVEVSSL